MKRDQASMAVLEGAVVMDHDNMIGAIATVHSMVIAIATTCCARLRRNHVHEPTPDPYQPSSLPLRAARRHIVDRKGCRVRASLCGSRKQARLVQDAFA